MTNISEEDMYLCDICEKNFYDNDTYWKCTCRKCGKGCCPAHRVEETGDYDDHCICTDCVGYCHICTDQPQKDSEQYKTFCKGCRKVVCRKHSSYIGYCLQMCDVCNNIVELIQSEKNIDT